MRGGGDSNGKSTAEDPSSPITADEHTIRNTHQPTPYPPHEDFIGEYMIKEDDYGYLYATSPYPFCHLEPFAHLSSTPPTPPMPRSAPYVVPEHRAVGYKGYTYEFLQQPEPIQYQKPFVSEQVDTNEAVILPEPTEPIIPSRAIRIVIHGDIAECIQKTILVFQHILPSNAIVPQSLRGYISYLYDEVPTGLTDKDNNVTRSANIFGWTPRLPRHELASSALPPCILHIPRRCSISSGLHGLRLW